MIQLLSDASFIVELRSVTRTFGDFEALKATDLALRSGEYVTITGASGSGKSTLLNLLGLLDRPSEGSVWIAGKQVDGLSDDHRAAIRGRTIGFVFQGFHLLDSRTATQNVELGMLYQRIAPAERKERAIDSLKRVGLAHRLNASPQTMSGGECQRVAIARALASGVEMLLADEPTGNLDIATGSQVLELFDQLNASGMTLVVVTHNNDVAQRGSRQLTMSDGHLRETDPGVVS